jgi:glutamate synthase domain-containing protein 2/glutamate synthase domain-containing protein 1/glutamate synthase domain-containing protein 3
VRFRNEDPGRETGARSAGPDGLYDPAFEHDACGVGFVARMDGRPDHAVIRDAVEILVNLEHRGAVGGDKATGDGAGLLVQIPDRFLRDVCLESGFRLPESGQYGVGMVFLPRDPRLADEAVRTFEDVCLEQRCEVLGWRRVPVEAGPLGEFAKASQPDIRQVFLSRGGAPPDAFERKLYVVRRIAEKRLASGRRDGAGAFYVAGLSARTVAYKGMLIGTQLAAFYPDLRDERFQSAFAVLHQRYSTNTFPSWSLAQPFRFLAHNGEINTLRGNVNRMRARESILESELFGADIERLKPVIDEGGSDSAMLDNVLELLVLGGRSLPHAVMMLVPEAWGSMYLMGEDRRAFYEYHAAVMEPWDGPAALAFADGRYVGAALDRNGLRPARYTVTRDGRVILASEAGVLETPEDRIVSRGKLRPGRMLLVDLEQHRIIPDSQIKATISRQRPYRHWVAENRISLRGLLMPSHPPGEDPKVLLRKQHAFGYTAEHLNLVLAPMAAHGQEAVGSMGNDAALAVLSDRPQLLFDYFKQLFAQVTNPPIDPLREELVMSLMSFVGRQRNLLTETPEHCRQLKLNHPVLTPEDMQRLRHANHPELGTADLDTLFPAGGDGSALEAALSRLFEQAEKAIDGGTSILILTDRNVDAARAPIPSLLAASGLHHHLIRKRLRTRAGIVVESGDPREVMHFALLIAYGANAVSPYLALATVKWLCEEGLLETSPAPEEAMDAYITAVKKGLLKTLSRMGISTIRSFHGAQIFEAVGLGSDLIERYFPGTVSRLGGIGLDEIAWEAGIRHARAFPQNGSPAGLLDPGGAYNNRVGGEKHLLTAEAIYKLQQACWTDDYKVFKEYSRLIDEQTSRGVTLRSLLGLRADAAAIPLGEVEPVEKILPRFTSGAMSLGSISPETHEVIAIAMNRLGARSNSGEGGEDPARYAPLPGGESRCSRTKQVASGRFGVTIEYLVHADELQIKIAQGAKPGEGGQLPGHKVSEEIARVRYTTPGVTLISPPPHHDIYSIEDIAQLIFDLKMANPKARVSVKLVSEAGVGTIAAGVAKAKADMVLIAGHDGGTGASPLTAIKWAGLPWELGLAETQQTLVRNRLRDRIRIQVDGQLRTGRDLAIAALLGAEEFGFGTITLVALGCVMMRKCHLNTCPVGIATQDKELRSRFVGRPEYVERFMRFVAEELREWMARLGFRTVDEMVGRAERLEALPSPDARKARRIDLRPLITPASGADGPGVPVRCVRRQEPGIRASFDDELLARVAPTLETKAPIRIDMPVRNVHRSIGTGLSGEIARRYGLGGLPPDTITLSLTGSAGQSLGAFLAAGVTIRVEGDANDYVGKGLSGGKIILVPPRKAGFDPASNVIAGNVALYGAVRGEAYLYGLAGERFAIRNSGARAVVEGVGDHGCEYMTGGVIVVLGTTGYNFAAGMTGGIAYVYNDSGAFDTRCNLDTVDLESVWTQQDQNELHALVEAHLRHTGSLRARQILDTWEAALPSFVKVMPIDYRESLERMRLQEGRERETVSATEEVYDG